MLQGERASGQASSSKAQPARTLTWEETKEGIRSDFDDNYFVSGDAAMDVYDANCEFADPFVSFKGVDRFKQNLSNFGKITCGPAKHHFKGRAPAAGSLNISESASGNLFTSRHQWECSASGSLFTSRHQWECSEWVRKARC
jgi:hypothetical protein